MPVPKKCPSRYPRHRSLWLSTQIEAEVRRRTFRERTYPVLIKLWGQPASIRLTMRFSPPQTRLNLDWLRRALSGTPRRLTAPEIDLLAEVGRDGGADAVPLLIRYLLGSHDTTSAAAGSAIARRASTAT